MIIESQSHVYSRFMYDVALNRHHTVPFTHTPISLLHLAVPSLSLFQTMPIALFPDSNTPKPNPASSVVASFHQSFSTSAKPLPHYRNRSASSSSSVSYCTADRVKTQESSTSSSSSTSKTRSHENTAQQGPLPIHYAQHPSGPVRDNCCISLPVQQTCEHVNNPVQCVVPSFENLDINGSPLSSAAAGVDLVRYHYESDILFPDVVASVPLGTGRATLSQHNYNTVKQG